MEENKEAKNLKSFLSGESLQKFFAFGTLILLVLFFSLVSENFLKGSNLITILLATCVNGILALGVTFVIITGGIDLSIGTVMTFTSVVCGVVTTKLGMPIWIGIIASLLTGALTGLITGVLVSKLSIPAFIATLGMMMVTKGLSLVLSGAAPVYFTNKGYEKIAMGNIIPSLNIPNAVFIFLALALIASYILNKTILGRYNFAIGSNKEATRLSGVNVTKWETVIYILNGIFCAIAGIVMSSRLGSAQPALGQGYELEAIAAVVIGGASLSGGVGTILGTVIGAFIMSVLSNGLKTMAVPQEWQTVVIGAVVILAVFIDILRRRKQKETN